MKDFSVLNPQILEVESFVVCERPKPEFNQYHQLNTLHPFPGTT